MAKARMRHIALSVKDPRKAADFFINAFGLEEVGGSGRGTIYLSDGTINIAMLARDGKPLGYQGEEEFYGIDHFGFWFDDVEEGCEQVEAAGATHVMGNKSGDPTSYFEIKYRTPMGEIFDVTTSGWRGAVKEVGPIG